MENSRWAGSSLRSFMWSSKREEQDLCAAFKAHYQLWTWRDFIIAPLRESYNKSIQS